MSEDHTQTQERVTNGHAPEESLFQKICHALHTEQAPGESAEDFKVRAVTAFSNMDQWPDDKYEQLDKDVQDWVYDATTTHKNNREKKRKKLLPAMPGLDQAVQKAKRGRATLSEDVPAKRGRTRTSGEDCLTRTMKLLVADPNPDILKAADLVKTLETKYGKEYSTAAVRYAQQAFMTARDLINQRSQYQSPAQAAPITQSV